MKYNEGKDISDCNFRRHSGIKSAALHILPGIAGGAAYCFLVPSVTEAGYPNVMALNLACLFVIIPAELGIMLISAKREGAAFFGGTVRNMRKLGALQYLLWIPAVFIATGVLFKLFGFTTDLAAGLFRWIPDYLRLDLGLRSEFERGKLVITYVLFFILIVIAVPVLEELYFRGFLLPRMPLMPNWLRPGVHCFLFAVYHTWTPWMIPVRTLGIMPLAYVADRKKNVIIGTAVHCIVNSFDFAAAIVFLTAM